MAEALDAITITATPAQYGGQPQRRKVAGVWQTVKPQNIAVRVRLRDGALKFYRQDVECWTLTGRGRFSDGKLRQPRCASMFPEDDLPGDRLPVFSAPARKWIVVQLTELLAEPEETQPGC